MKKILLLLYFCPLFLFSQSDSTNPYRPSIKTSLTLPWGGIRSVSLSYEMPIFSSYTIEYEGFYSFGIFYPVEDLTLKYLKVDLRDDTFSGGVNVTLKKYYAPTNPVYMGFSTGYQQITYANEHTICTEVGEVESNICPCLSFEENKYDRNVNRLNGAMLLGFQNLLKKKSSRFTFDFSMGVGIRYIGVTEPEKFSSVRCNNFSLINQDVIIQYFHLFSGWTLDNRTAHFYFPINLKIGYSL